MGYSKWDTGTYHQQSFLRASTGVDDFQHDKDMDFDDVRDIHEALLPTRINKKVCRKLESRDSNEHPESFAIIINLDVTGSNIDNAKEARKALPQLMDLLVKHIPNPQIAIWANDDYLSVGQRAFQASDFESDNRIDEWFRSLKMVGVGGGNDRESYDLPLYCAAYKTVADCYKKRKKRGLMFLYADEMFPSHTEADQIRVVFGDQVEKGEKIETVVKKAQKYWDIYQLWPADSGERRSRERGIELFGKDHVISLVRGKDICTMVGVIAGAREGKLNSAEISSVLKELGVEKEYVDDLAVSLTNIVEVSSSSAGDDIDRMV